MGWVDILVMLGIFGLFFGLVNVAGEWRQPLEVNTVPIDLGIWALPKYTLFSLFRGLTAYIFSLIFTLIYGYWAAKDVVAQKVLIPLLDILQSIPVLSFLPGLVIALRNMFPNSTVGLELAAILAIFTGQAWNMTFSYYHSLRSVPSDQREAAAIYGFTWWEKLRWVELPFSTMGLVWNSMMSMAGGWFFLMISETIQIGDNNFRLPGIGSYMSAANDANDTMAKIYAIIAMTLMIVGLDQFLWRPVVVWAQKFRVEEGGHMEASSSWFLDWLKRSEIWNWFSNLFARPAVAHPRSRETEATPVSKRSTAGVVVSTILFAGLLMLLIYGAFLIVRLIWQVSGSDWMIIFISAFWTLIRVLISIAIGTLWAVPAGLAIGLSPRLSRIFQPIVQVVASFPAPMLFTIVIGAVIAIQTAIAGPATDHSPLQPIDWGSVVLMLLGTQWYILFNMIAGAMAVPADLREAARSFDLTPWQRFWKLYMPACFPYLVTGWVTAAGGAWNASIVAEYITFKVGDKSTVLAANYGLGSVISKAAAHLPEPDAPMLAAATAVMSIMVILFNRTVWRRLYTLAEERYSLTK